MPLRRVSFAEGYFYHIYNRGVAKQDIFFVDSDRLRFLKRVEQYAEKFSVSVIAYCLMPNHFHFVLRQDGEISLGYFLRHLLVSYAMYLNKKYERVGPIFQGRFKAKLITDDAYMMQLVRYLHQNPREIMGPKTDLSHYEWSSYRNYLGLNKDDFVKTEFVLKYFSQKDTIADFKKFCEAGFTEKELEEIEPLTLETGT